MVTKSDEELLEDMWNAIQDKDVNNTYQELLTDKAVLACQHGSQSSTMSKESFSYAKIGDDYVLTDKAKPKGTFGECDTRKTKCKLQMRNEWYSLATSTLIYDDEGGLYHSIPTTNSYMVCKWGMGLIIPVDSGQKVVMTNENRSVLGGVDYSGEIGIVWIRDTTGEGSSLSMGEIIGGYFIEVDYITWDIAATILAASASYDMYRDLLEAMAVGATGTYLSVLVCTGLGITAAPATITSLVVGAVVGIGWNWLNKIDRSTMFDCFKGMGIGSQTEYMQIKFYKTQEMASKTYSIVPRTQIIPSPIPEMYGNWIKDKYAYLYPY